MDEKTAIDILKQVKEILDDRCIEYWLDCGTLLGAIREGRLIPWDIDIDLGTWDTEKQKVNDALKEFHNKDLGKNWRGDIHFYHLRNDKATQTWFVPNQTVIRQTLNYLHRVLSDDSHVIGEGRMPIFTTRILYEFFYSLPPLLTKRIDKVVLALYKKCEKNGCGYVQISVPSHYFKNLSTIRFYGMEFKVPADTEEYLEYRYGKDWRVPKKKYNSGEHDGAIYQ